MTYHNIIGIVPKQWWLSKLAADGDGVVSRKSAHANDAVSEISVPAEHTSVHTHPAAVLEVRRILLEHLAELDGQANSPLKKGTGSELMVQLPRKTMVVRCLSPFFNGLLHGPPAGHGSCRAVRRDGGGG